MTSMKITYDWRSTHGVAAAVINSALTSITVAVAMHVAIATGAASTLRAVLIEAIVALMAVMMTLAWGALSPRRPSGSKVLAHSIMWIFLSIWAGVLGTRPDWDPRLLANYSLVMVIVAAVIGIGYWLTIPNVAIAKSAMGSDERASLMRRLTLAGQWEERVRRVLRISGRVVAIENFPEKSSDSNRIGYTVEMELPQGGSSWTTVRRAAPTLAADMDLPIGCEIGARPGKGRRTVLIDVTLVNVFDEPHPLPADGYGPLSIHDPLMIMVDRRGVEAGVVLRSTNAGIYGETGSGKTNLGNVLGARIAQCADALLCDIDTTGGRLSGALLGPFLRGEVDKPAVWWPATTEDEALLLLRALDRAARARNDHYGDLRMRHGDDKMPISPDYPAFIVRIDECKYVVGKNADQQLYDGAKAIIDDHRNAGIRAIIMSLRGTDECVRQSVQAQLGIVGALRVTSRAELRTIFGGSAIDIDTRDTAYPGCVQMRRDSGDDVRSYHVYRIVGEQVHDIARAVAPYQPEVDRITWLALNGRYPDGKPMSDLLPNELDCCKTRWERIFPMFGYEHKSSKPNFDISDKIKEILPEQTNLDKTNDDPLEWLDSNTNWDIATSKPDEPKKPTSRPDFDSPAARSPREWNIIANTIKESGADGADASTIAEALKAGGRSADRATIYRWINATATSDVFGAHIEKRADRPGSSRGRWYWIE